MELRCVGLVFVLCVSCLTKVSIQSLENGLLDGKRHYFFAVPEDIFFTNRTLYISSELTASVHIEAPFVSMNITKIIKDTTIALTLDSELELHGSSLSWKGIYIESNNSLTVYVLSYGVIVSSNVLFVNLLDSNSNEFYVYTYDSLLQNEFVVATPFDKTEIQIDLKISSGYMTFERRTYLSSNVSTIRKVLNSFDTLQLQSYGDLTGTYINSSKPITVLSGSQCARVSGNCGFVASQMKPISDWKMNYITSNLTNNGAAVLRIMASEDNTAIRINNQVVTSLNKGRFYERQLQNATILSVQGSKPISIVQFYDLTDVGNTIIGESSMMSLPAVDQYLTSYIFEVPTGFRINYLVIYVETSNIGGIRLDDQVVTLKSQKNIAVKDLGLSFSVGRLTVSSGKHKLTHTVSGTRFGALLYGLVKYKSYGFFLGYANGPTCNPPCNHDGVCIADDTCHCPLGYLGKRCELGTALANELKPRLNTLIDVDDNNFMDPLSWYSEPPFSDSNKVCYVKILLQNSTVDTVVSAVSSTTAHVTFGNFSTGPVDSSAGVTGSTRFACLEVRCPFVTMNGVSTDTFVTVTVDGQNDEKCRVRNYNQHLSNFVVQSPPGEPDEMEFTLEVGKNYGPYYGVYMAIGKRDKARFLAEHKCNSGREFDFESYNPDVAVLAEYVC